MFKAANQSFMDTASQQINWRYETLPRQTKKALEFLSKENWLKKSNWKEVKSFFRKEVPQIAKKLIKLN